jgi:ankyrin repeat protein
LLSFQILQPQSDNLHMIRYVRSQHGQSALLCAALTGHADCVQLLLEAGANKEARGNVRVWATVELIRIIAQCLRSPY